MAQDVNQSEMEVAALVRSALVARISKERYELWMPRECQWQWEAGALSVRFPTEFTRQIAKRILHDDLRSALTDVVGYAAPLTFEVIAESIAPNAIAAQERVNESAFTAASQVVSTRQTCSDDALSVSVDVTCEVSSRAATTHANRPALENRSSEIVGAIDSSAAHATKQSLARQRTSRVEATQCALPRMNESREGVITGNFLKKEETSDTATERAKSDHWSDFLPGMSNQMAWTTMNLIANEPGRMTPALIHGPHGSGKSHLATALTQRLRTQRRQRRVLHITAEQFTNDFTEAIRGSGLPMMRRKYRDVDTLILDDLHFLIGKKATINELRQTVDNLLKGSKQIVFLSDRPLHELDPLGTDFVGRLRGGLVSPLLPLDEATRYQLLKRDLRDADVKLADDIVLQIATRAIGDGRLLKGITKRLMATAYIQEQALTWDQCWNAIYDLIQATQPIVRLGDIERVVCEIFGLEPNSLQSDRKTRLVSQPRMLAMFLARKYTPAAYQEIGDFFGNRRHSTVISAEKTVGSWLQENAQLQVARGSLGIRDAMRHVEANLHVG